ncbi:PRC-barrel domain-containing protein [Lacimicrobium sp. SS2-24]|uniref:PRC-barrel domain-containing protein n=1 Tax=Lacimicrobium sp. SS2-24 TaxID=2005569 RepID=UPI000B4BD6C8|nr:PRC-barrel domain-containing protein [Lacimicrobium sp. SS2-24]
MNYTTKEAQSKYDRPDSTKASATLLSAATITGDEVCNMQDEKLGKIEDIMLDLTAGKIRYAVLSAGGFLGLGDHLYAVPWTALKLDKKNKRFMLDVDVERLKKAPGFDKDNWPDMADTTWNSTIESYYAR